LLDGFLEHVQLEREQGQVAHDGPFFGRQLVIIDPEITLDLLVRVVAATLDSYL
jgi:hypothetical protein